MTVVVDANVAVYWTVEAPLSEKAVKVLRLEKSIIAPDLIIAEVTNALYMQVKDRLDKVERAMDGLEFLPRWFAELVPSHSLRNRAMGLALELEHPAYDCFYLALALSRQVTLISADGRFLRKAAAKGYRKLIAHLEDW